MTDINTVFYFADNQSQYEDNRGKLSSYTISFVPQGNGVGYIYKNNVKYGGVSADELIDIIENTPGIIPFASTSRAGIIKLGDGLKTTDDSGTVAVDFSGVPGIVTRAIQDYFDRNPISGGSDVKYTQTVTSGTELGTIRINGEDKKIFAPTIPQPKDYSLHSASLNGTTLTISQKDGTHVEANLSTLAGQGQTTQPTNYSITDVSLNDNWLSIKQGGANVIEGVDLSSIAGGSEYELPAASSSALGGIKIGFTANGKKYPVELDELTKKAYVEVPWQPSTTVVEGYIVDLVNGTMVIVTDKQGNTGNYSNTAQIHVYNNGVEYDDFTVTIGDPTLSDGSAIPAGKVSATYENHNVTVTLNNLSGFSAKTLSIPLTVTLGNGSARPLVITCVGVSIGADGEPGSSINLKTSAAAIRTDYYKNNAYPTSIDVWASITSGSSSIQTINIVPGSEDAERIGFSFKYHYNGGNDVVLTNGTISNIDPSKDGLVVELYYNNIRIDSEEIPYVRDGADGIGVSAINYRINVLSSSVIVSDGTNGKVVNGDVRFVITRQEGSNAPQEITDDELEEQGFSDGIITLTCLMDTRSKTAVYSNGAWNISAESNDAYLGSPYSAIYVRSATNTMLASAIVPFVIKGEKGEGGGGGQVQPLQGVVMRMVNWQEGTTYYGGIIPDSTGVKYMDVVLYTDGYYYRPVVEYTNEAPVVLNDETGEYVTNSKWAMFFPSDSAAFIALIAKYAYVENLTAREVVITDEDNNLEAGVTSGEAISSLLANTDIGSVRFWAGKFTNSLTQCPFYVTNEGYLKTTNAELSGNIIINTSNGNVLINENGVEIKKGGDGIKVDSNGVLRWDGNSWVPLYASRKVKRLLLWDYSSLGWDNITRQTDADPKYQISKTDDFVLSYVASNTPNASNAWGANVLSYLVLPSNPDSGCSITLRTVQGKIKLFPGENDCMVTGEAIKSQGEAIECAAGNRIELVYDKPRNDGYGYWFLNSSGGSQ